MWDEAGSPAFFLTGKSQEQSGGWVLRKMRWASLPEGTGEDGNTLGTGPRQHEPKGFIQGTRCPQQVSQELSPGCIFSRKGLEEKVPKAVALHLLGKGSIVTSGSSRVSTVRLYCESTQHRGVNLFHGWLQLLKEWMSDHSRMWWANTA